VHPAYRPHHRPTGIHHRPGLPRADRFGTDTQPQPKPQGPAAYSAARLAAEAAFAAPPAHSAAAAAPATDGLPALVTIKRARLALAVPSLVNNPALPVVDTTLPTTQEAPANIAPRVFRVDARSGPADEQPAALQVDGAAQTDPASNKQRRQNHRRPGPVTTHVLPVVRAVPAPDLQTVRAQMAELTATLQAIQQAQALQLLDPSFDRQWQALLRQARALG
jgi:hypothetical protein